MRNRIFATVVATILVILGSALTRRSAPWHRAA